jgi:hypothetical protein
MQMAFDIIVDEEIAGDESDLTVSTSENGDVTIEQGPDVVTIDLDAAEELYFALEIILANS